MVGNSRVGLCGTISIRSMIFLSYIPIAIIMGGYNAYLVNTWVDWSKGRRIKHFWNGLIHLTFATLLYFKYASGRHIDLFGLPIYLNGIRYAICLLCVARIFFNLSYNYFHEPRLSLRYISKTPRSVLDKAEKFIFGDGAIALFFYIGLLILLTIVKIN